MRYALLLWGDEAAEAAMPEAEARRIIEAHGEFARRLREQGKYIAGAGLEPSAGARVVRRGSAEVGDVVTDGPFIETKEQLGGIYLVDCDDADEALRLAREIPLSPGLVVEVRAGPY